MYRHNQEYGSTDHENGCCSNWVNKIARYYCEIIEQISVELLGNPKGSCTTTWLEITSVIVAKAERSMSMAYG